MPKSLPLDVSDPGFFIEIRRLQAEIFAEDAAETKAASHLRMRGRGVQDLAVLRAFELVPRQTFVAEEHAELAARDLALPIGCGQTLDEPWLIARMIEALEIRPSDRVLQIGAGSGYATAILAQLAHEVRGIERHRSLALSAQARLTALGITNARIDWGDGLADAPEAGAFDRILVHGLLREVPASLMDRLGGCGVVVCGRPAEVGQMVVRISHWREGASETPICPCRLQPTRPGPAQHI